MGMCVPYLKLLEDCELSDSSAFSSSITTAGSRLVWGNVSALRQDKNPVIPTK